MSAPEQFYDLSFEQLDDGTIRLEQKDYCGESYIIDLHPAQLRHIAERVGLLLPAPAVAWPRGFKQRMVRLQADVDYLAGDVWMGEICERLGDGLAFKLGMIAVLDTINDLLLDTGITSETGSALEAPASPLDASTLPDVLPNVAGAAGGPSEPSLFD
jgi:hypothetical protein